MPLFPKARRERVAQETPAARPPRGVLTIINLPGRWTSTFLVRSPWRSQYVVLSPNACQPAR